MENSKKEINISKVKIFNFFKYLFASFISSFLLMFIIQHFGEFKTERLDLGTDILPYECFVSPFDDYCYHPSKDFHPIFYNLSDTPEKFNDNGELLYNVKVFEFYIPQIFNSLYGGLYFIAIVIFALLYLRQYITNKYSIKIK